MPIVPVRVANEQSVICRPPLVDSLGAAGPSTRRWVQDGCTALADLARGLLLLLLLTARSAESLGVIYLVAFLESSISQFAGPAKSALVPHLVGEEQLIAANALNAQTSALTSLIGPMLGEALMGLVGLPSVVLLDSVSYLGSAGLIALIRAPPRPIRGTFVGTSRGVVAVWSRAWQEGLEGLRVVRKDPVVTAVFVVWGIVMLSQGLVGCLSLMPCWWSSTRTRSALISMPVCWARYPARSGQVQTDCSFWRSRHSLPTVPARPHMRRSGQPGGFADSRTALRRLVGQPEKPLEVAEEPTDLRGHELVADEPALLA